MAKRADIEARRRQVAALLLNHRSQREIADALGVSLGTINSDVKAIREAWRDQYARNYEDRVAEELAKLDLAEKHMMTQVIQGKPHSVDRLLSIMNHRARLLGLYAPEKHEVLTLDAIDAELERLEAELSQHDQESASG